jgi:hypothetical protein
MDPNNVNPKNFKVEKIIYNSNDFSIAIGIWVDDKTRRFAMRWNEVNSPSDKGFPLSSGHPMWFQLPIDIQDIIITLIGHSGKINAI